MKISDAINELQKLLDAHGDLEVGVVDSEFGCSDPATVVMLVQSNHDREHVSWGSRDDAELGKQFVLFN